MEHLLIFPVTSASILASFMVMNIETGGLRQITWPQCQICN